MKTLNIIVGLVLMAISVCAQTNNWYKFPSGIPEDANRFIYRDSTDAKWIGGYNEGMHRYKNGAWTHYTPSNSGLTDDDVRQSCFDNNGNLWVATWNKLNKFNPANNTWSNYNVTGQVYDILSSVQVDNQNRVWVGTDGGADSDDGLYMFNGTSWTFYNPTNSPLSGRWITQLKKDKIGKIWGCHAKGLFEINGTAITNHLFQPLGFPTFATATCVDFDSYNNKWVGIYDGGIAKYTGTGWTVYTAANSGLPENLIWSIAVDADNVVWIGTENKGLVRFDGTTWTVFNTSNSIIGSNRIDALSIDKLNNLWIAPNYAGVVIYNPNAISGISGYVYNDLNLNGIKDAAEPLLPDQVIDINTNALTAVTDASGNYYCPILNAGTYTAKVIRNSPHITATAPAVINFTFNNAVSSLTDRNFGIQLTPNIHDISVDYSSINQPRPGFKYSADITVKNSGSVISNNINVKLKYNTNLVLDSTSYPYLLNQGDSLTWNIGTLAALGKKSIKVYFHLLPNTGLLGQSLVANTSAYGTLADFDSTNNKMITSDLVVGSFDPNDKLSSPAGTGPIGAIPPTTGNLTYTIRFQNTGTASAVNIVVKDTIDNRLDLSLFAMIAASHDYSAVIKGRIITWTFSNINLPDSNSNYNASNGFIKYKLNLKTGLPVGSQIKNTAYIFFDFNPAVITDEVVNTITNLVVPIRLIRFGSKCSADKTILEWQSGPELNTSSYRVQSSVDGISWENSGIVNAKGNYSTYNFSNADTKRLLYRLAVSDIDGKIEYSNVITGSCEAHGLLSVYPVPAKNDLFISIKVVGNADRALEILNNEGKLLKKETKSLHSGVNKIRLDISTLPPGNYILRARDSKSVIVRTFIKIK